MSNVGRTISYLKRNGIKSTCYAILERIDSKNIDLFGKKALEYQGRKDYSEREPQIKVREDITFSILVPAYETRIEHLYEMMDSVMNQTYNRVQLVIADASETDGVEKAVQLYRNSGKQSEVCYKRLSRNGGISENTNAALEAATGEYIGLLDHDDLLTSDALYEVAKKLQEADYEMLYSDEDKCNDSVSAFYEPHFKTGFNFDLLLSNNYICHFLIMKSSLMKELKFRKEYDGAQDYDLVLRAAGRLNKAQIAHIPKVLYHWRCHEDSTAANPESKRYAYDAGKRAIEDFLKGKNLPINISHTSHLGFYATEYEGDSLEKQIETIFNIRKDVAAVCGRVVKGSKVVGGPIIFVDEFETELFVGLRKAYGGYLHRAYMYMNVDRPDDRAVIFRPEYQERLEGRSLLEKCAIIEKQGDLLLYSPNFVVEASK